MSKPLRISMQYFAESDADPKSGDSADNNTNTGGDPNAGGQPAGEPNTDGLPKTQEELDKLLERRIAKEQKKWAKQANIQEDTDNTGTASDPGPDNSAELAALRTELIEAKAQSAAAMLGCRADCIEDAVYLAVRNASKDDEPDDEDIKTALEELLKKYPGWKNNSEKPAGGFKIGAESQGENRNATDDMLKGIFGIKKK